MHCFSEWTIAWHTETTIDPELVSASYESPFLTNLIFKSLLALGVSSCMHWYSTESSVNGMEWMVFSATDSMPYDLAPFEQNYGQWLILSGIVITDFNFSLKDNCWYNFEGLINLIYHFQSIDSLIAYCSNFHWNTYLHRNILIHLSNWYLLKHNNATFNHPH